MYTELDFPIYRCIKRLAYRFRVTVYIVCLM